jgi:hypothetical protein
MKYERAGVEGMVAAEVFMKYTTKRATLLLAIRIVIILSLLILGATRVSFAATPVVFFSDMTDAPTSGWNGSATQGAAVSIWGINFGAIRGASTVTLCGVTLNADSSFAEWGATTNPTTARGLQRITFWLNSSMTSGSSTISVTTTDGTSTSIPFYCRALGANRIYFVSRLDGSDSYTGLVTSFTSGTAGPWKTATKVRRTVVAGDVVYFRGNGTGIFNEDDGNSSVIYFCQAPPGQPTCSSGQEHNNGIVNKSITLASYPGEAAQFGDSSRSTVFRHSYNDILTYWTFSKFITRSVGDSTYWMTQNVPMQDDHLRFVGLDMATYGDSTALVFEGGTGGQTNLVVYGNYLHNAGNAGNISAIPATRCYGLYFGGYGFHNHIDVGWNEMAYQARGRGIQIYGHTVTDWIDDLKIHDNFIHDNSMTGAVLGGGDGNTGTDGTSSHNYQFVRTLYFYNNIIAANGNNVPAEGSSSAYPGIQIAVSGSGILGGDYFLYNNTFFKNFNRELDMAGSPATITLQNNVIYTTSGYYLRSTCSACSGSNHNLYYGAGTSLPTWESSTLVNIDPQLLTSNPISYADFQLKSTSPAKDAGTTIPLVTKDFYGTQRPINSVYDLGVYEFGVSSGTRPNPPVLNPVP